MIPQRGGLPHSDIHGSKPARGSPWLFAACHVLHRLLVPRHPPNALLILNPVLLPNARRQTPDVKRQTSETKHHHAQEPSPLKNSLQSSVVSLQREGFRPKTVDLRRSTRRRVASQYPAQFTTPLTTIAASKRDDPWQPHLTTQQPRSLPVRQSPNAATNTPKPQPKPAPKCQPGRNRVVLRAQERTRTRFTKQKNATTQAQPKKARPGSNTASPNHPTLSGADQTTPIEEPSYQSMPQRPPAKTLAQRLPTRRVLTRTGSLTSTGIAHQHRDRPRAPGMEAIGLEPITPCLQSRCSTR